MKLIIINNQIIGTTTPDDPNGYTLIDPPEGFDDDLSALTFDEATNMASYNLASYQGKRITEVKAQVTAAINGLQWRIERAQEREQIGTAGEKVADVLKEREALRKAGNRVEELINNATDIAAVKAIEFTVLPEDAATLYRLSRLEFMNRFTDDEMQTFVAATKQNPALEAYFIKLQSAEGVVLNDPVTMAGVQALELLGIIPTGRATELLAVAP